MLVVAEKKMETTRKNYRVALGSLKIAAPLIRATISNPGLEASERDVGRTFAMLALRTRQLAEKVWDKMRERGWGDGHPSELVKLAQQVAQQVAFHWSHGSDLSETEMAEILEMAMDHVDGQLADREADDPGYQQKMPRVMEWQLAWLKASMTISGAIANGSSTLGHDPDKLRDTINAHMGGIVSDWADSLSPDDEETRMVIEQSLLGMVSQQYATLWLREIAVVRTKFRRMSEEERREAGRRGHDLDGFLDTVKQTIGRLKDSAPVIDEVMGVNR